MQINLASVFSKKTIIIAFAFLIAFLTVTTLDANVANAAFSKIEIGGETVGAGTDLDEGLFADMNVILMIFLSIAGFVVIACLIFAGIKLATAQGNPQARTQGFIGLGMALLGGWVVYKALDLAGWIKGIST